MTDFGTRPEAVKMFPVVHALRDQPGIDTRVCVTAQHRTMLDQVLEIAQIIPDIELGVIQANQTLDGLLARLVTGLGEMLDLLAAFRRLYPGIAIDYQDLPSKDLRDQFVAGAKAGRANPDLLLSSAMHMQIKLVNDGYAQSYESQEMEHLPRWANWKNQAWGVTAEPIVILYNKKLLSDARVPRNHRDFVRLLERRDPDLLGRIATYDPDTSSVGYLCLSQDNAISGHVWQMAHGLGANRARFFATSDEVIQDVSSGRSIIGYNVVGSYALDAAAKNPDLGVVFPSDYTLVMSRIATIPTRARHPAAARLFLDFLLSTMGQSLLASHSMPSVRNDAGPSPGSRETASPMRAIRVGPELLIVLRH